MSPIDIQDIFERAKYSVQMGDHEEAERLLRSYLTNFPENREARLLLGTTFAKEGKLNEAADEFIALLGSDPQDLEALNNVAVIYRRQGRLQDALDYLKDAIEIDPTRAEFFYNIGNIHKQLGNSKAASMAYSRVIELDPNYVQAYNNLGTIYDQLKEYDKAFGVFRKGLALDQNNPTLHFNYGVCLEANGHLEEAANEYRTAMRSKPGWLAPMNNLGIVLFKQGRHDKAIATFNHVLSSDPFNAEAYNNIGVVLADQGRGKEAIKNYRRAIEVDQRYAKAVLNLERALENSGDFADAVVELEKLVKLSPDSAEIRNRLAGLYMKMERYPEALEQAESALDWEPESTQALRIKGAVQRVMGNDVQAQASFEKILSLDPGNYAFLLDLADIHFRRKEYKEAEERIQSYLIRRPNDREAKLLLGKLYAEMGNRTHAIQIFEELSKADPNDAEALAAAAELHKEAGSLEKALRAADNLVNLQGKRATTDDLLDLNKSLEFYENAVNAYSTSVREMWDRNIKLMAGGEEEPDSDDDLSLLMGAAEVSRTIDEETEALFTEGVETFAGEEETGDLVLGDDDFGEIPEEGRVPRYGDPLDALAEDSSEGFPDWGSSYTPSPDEGKQNEVIAENQPEMKPEGNKTPYMDNSAPPPPYPMAPPMVPPMAPEAMPPPYQPPVQPRRQPYPNEDFSQPLENTPPPQEYPDEDILMSEEIEPPQQYSPEDDIVLSEEESELPLQDIPFKEVLVSEGKPRREVPELPPEEPEALPEETALDEDMELPPEEPEALPEETAPEEDMELPPEEPEALPGEAAPEEDMELPPEEPEALSGEAAPEEDMEFPLEEPEALSGETAPEEDMEFPLEEPEIPLHAPAMTPAADAGIEAIDISAIIELLVYLKRLTEKLPVRELNSYNKGRFPAALDSVIDSLHNLVIIKESE